MHDASRGFFFYDDATDAGRAAFGVWRAGGARGRHLVDIAARGDKGGLFRELAAGIPLPEYFGHNFDALEECLRDVTVLGDGGVALLHGGHVGLAPTDFETYVDVLATAADHWRAAGRPDFLQSAFPVTLEASVRRSVALAEDRARAREARREELRRLRARK